jgi:putative Ca2+/H+ antiporter (TMEM165/GDT1 family)
MKWFKAKEKKKNMLKKTLIYLLTGIILGVGLVSVERIMSRDFIEMRLPLQLLLLGASAIFVIKPAMDYWYNKIESLMNKDD